MKMPLRIYIIIIFFLLSSACPLNAKQTGLGNSIRIGIFPLEPLNFLDQDNKAQGLYPDLIREIAKLEDIKIEFTPCSWGECMEYISSGKIDLITTIAWSSEREKTIDYNKEPIVDIWGEVFIRPGAKINTILDLAGKRVAIAKKDINGVNFMNTAEQFRVKVEIVELSTHDEIFNAIQNKTIDAGIAPQHFGLRHGKEHGVVGTSIMFSPFSVFLGAKKGKQTQLLNRIDFHLANWKSDKDSFYYQRVAFWMGGEKFEKEILPDWLRAFLGVILFGGILLLFFIYTLNKTVKSRTKDLLAANTDLKTKTEQLKLSEQKLAKKHAEFLAIFNSITDAIVFVNLDRCIVMINPALVLMMGYKQQEIVGKTTKLFYANPEDYHQQGKIRYNLNANVSSPIYEIEYRRKNGTVFLSENLGVPVKNQDGDNIGFLAVIRDITDRKMAEEEKASLEEQLQQAQKMEAIGTLAGGIAHDFNNILAAIFGYTELAIQDTPEGSSIAEHLSKVLEASNRAKGLVQQILAFSRQSDPECIQLQLADLVADAMKMIRPSLPTTIEIILDIDPSIGLICADQTQIHQILMNLCTNAFHAMEDSGGRLDISLKETTLSRADLLHEPNANAGTYVKLSICDSGPGMAPEIKNRIFDPYFTTKPTGKGTGMGLAIVHGIVKRYGGFISFYSEPGEGTAFHVFFPVVEKKAHTEEESIDCIPKGTERVLFIDDEEILTTMGKNMLERRGYEVTVKNSSLDALETFQNNPDLFDVIITDQTMPFMTGGELATRMMQIRPDIPIILCTGYSTIISEEKAKSMGIREFALKPLAEKDFAKLLRKVLDAS